MYKYSNYRDRLKRSFVDATFSKSHNLTAISLLFLINLQIARNQKKKFARTPVACPLMWHVNMENVEKTTLQKRHKSIASVGHHPYSTTTLLYGCRCLAHIRGPGGGRVFGQRLRYTYGVFNSNMLIRRVG